MKKSHLIGALGACMLSVYSCGAISATLTPVVAGGLDDNPKDGVVDSVLEAMFILDAASRQISAIAEYDATIFDGQLISSASISGTIHVNNSLDTGVRLIDVLLFSGNGVLDETDFNISAVNVGTVSYHPPTDNSVSFDFDVTSVIQSFLDLGDNYIGARFEAQNVQAASLLHSNNLPILGISAVPIPTTFWLFGSGMLGLIGMARRKKAA